MARISKGKLKHLRSLYDVWRILHWHRTPAELTERQKIGRALREPKVDSVMVQIDELPFYPRGDIYYQKGVAIDVKPDPSMCHTPGYIEVVCGAMSKTPFVFPPGGA